VQEGRGHRSHRQRPSSSRQFCCRPSLRVMIRLAARKRSSRPRPARRLRPPVHTAPVPKSGVSLHHTPGALLHRKVNPDQPEVPPRPARCTPPRGRCRGSVNAPMKAPSPTTLSTSPPHRKVLLLPREYRDPLLVDVRHEGGGRARESACSAWGRRVIGRLKVHHVSWWRRLVQVARGSSHQKSSNEVRARPTNNLSKSLKHQPPMRNRQPTSSARVVSFQVDRRAATTRRYRDTADAACQPLVHGFQTRMSNNAGRVTTHMHTSSHQLRRPDVALGGLGRVHALKGRVRQGPTPSLGPGEFVQRRNHEIWLTAASRPQRSENVGGLDRHLHPCDPTPSTPAFASVVFWIWTLRQRTGGYIQCLSAGGALKKKRHPGEPSGSWSRGTYDSSSIGACDLPQEPLT